MSKLGTFGPGVSGNISQGRYSISTGGAISGRLYVQITAMRKTGKKVMDPQTNKLIDESEQYIPERYNRASSLTVTVTEQGPNRFNFTLESK